MTVLPNSFQTSNLYIDRAMALLTDPEFRVLMFTVRHIMGWQDKITDRKGCVSLTMYENGFVTKEGLHYCGCGLKRAAIIKAVQGLVDFGFISRIGKPTDKGQEYQLIDAIDWITLEARQVNKQTLNHKRTVKATDVRIASAPDVTGTSDITSTSDVTGTGTSDVTMQGNVGRTQTNPSSNASQTHDIDSKSPLKIKSGKYTPDENNAINALLDMWQKAANNIQPFAYSNKTFRAQAYELHKLNITPDLIRVYISNLRLDSFWRAKAISWNKVCSEIIPWLKAHKRMPEPSALSPIINDQPAEIVSSSSFQSFKTKKDVA